MMVVSNLMWLQFPILMWLRWLSTLCASPGPTSPAASSPPPCWDSSPTPRSSFTLTTSTIGGRKVAKCVVDDVRDGGHKHIYIEVITFSNSRDQWQRFQWRWCWCWCQPKCWCWRINYSAGADWLITRFMGSLTALLVLASMMPVFTGDLPKASYTKVFQEFHMDLPP